jgi:hypothetical protein
MNRVVGAVLVVLSLVLLGDVASGVASPPQPPPADEDTQAHIFQITAALLVPTMLASAVVWDRSRPLRSAWPLALAAAALVVSFALVYRLEHP